MPDSSSNPTFQNDPSTASDGVFAETPPPPTPVAPGSVEVRLEVSQRRLYEAFGELSLELASIYFGAVAVYTSENPDRVALCAHNLREVMKRLPRYLEVPLEADHSTMGDRVNGLEIHWRRVTGHPAWRENAAWIGEIEDTLRQFLDAVKVFFHWKDAERPKHRDQMARVLRSFDRAGQSLPQAIEKERVGAWIDAYSFFVKVAHHDLVPSPADFASRLARTEAFLLDQFRPQGVEDQKILEQIITEADLDAEA